MQTSSAPLGGIVVVSVEQAIAAPFASRQLADLGATVIKIEPPSGDFARHYDAVMSGQSANFVWANRGKQSVALDLATESGRATLRGLIAGADVFLHNMAPDAAQRLGIDASTLHLLHAGLVACEISGYGAGGPRSQDKAYDLAIQAEAGVFSVTGDAQPSKVGFSVADIGAAMYALTGILAALVRRERTGAGGAVSVSMLDVMAEWMSAPLYGAVYGGGQAERSGRRHHAISPYGTFALADGSAVLIAVQSDPEWRALATAVLGRPELAIDERYATNPARIAHVSDVEAAVALALAASPAEEVLERLDEARITWARVNDLAGLWNHEQLRARGRFTTARTPGGDVEVVRSPFEVSEWEVDAGGVPGLDEHDPALLGTVEARGRGRD